VRGCGGSWFEMSSFITISDGRKNNYKDNENDPTSDLVATTRKASARLSVRNLRKVFGADGPGQHVALEDINFEVHERELVAVLGPSGAGKTTLFRCVTGLLRPDSGVASVAGLDVGQLRGQQRRHIAVVFQQFNLVSRLSALDNVLAGRLGYVSAWRGWSRRFPKADRLLALECLDRVGLLTKAQQRADTLSGGQQQRVAIARALAQQPDIIIADEPIASLDPNISAEIMALLRDICHTDGVSVLCSLHQLHLATAYADRLIGLAGGKLVTDGPASEFDDLAASRVYGAERR